MEIYLIRHAFTPANNSNYNNQRGMREIAEDGDMPLDRVYGVRQALELGEFLNKIDGRTLIMVSPYKRSLETLKLALTKMSGSYEIIECVSLREIDSGIHYARNKEEVLELYPKADKFYEEYENSPLSTSYIDGEDEYSVYLRTIEVYDKIKSLEETKQYDNLFIFAHGTVNKWLYFQINNEYFNFKQLNCQVIKATGKGRGKEVFLPEAYAPQGYEIDTSVFKTKKLKR